ncbi:MAG: FAD-binding protein, partial [Pseudomonadota bacterium]|nr:FAD-binding protein [Pseudomonadota bacterium]
VYLRTRAECSAAIMKAVEDGRGTPNGGAYLDMRANKGAPKSGTYFMKFLKNSLPSAYNNVRQALNKKEAQCDELWEVRPSAHYMMGGIRVDANGKSIADKNSNNGVRGLYAAGQAMGGLFGANRLGSTSLTEGAVFGSRAGLAAALYSRNFNNKKINKYLFFEEAYKLDDLLGQKGNKHASQLKIQVQKECWNNLGPIRDKKRLKKTQQFISRWRKDLKKIKIGKNLFWNQSLIEYLDLVNMIDTAELMTYAALERDGSLGGHVRSDCKDISIFSKPYSTNVKVRKSQIEVSKIDRKRTELKKLIEFKFKEQKRFLEAKLLRLLPMRFKDAIIEKRYKKIMGSKEQAPPLEPGSIEAAVGDQRVL